MMKPLHGIKGLAGWKRFGALGLAVTAAQMAAGQGVISVPATADGGALSGSSDLPEISNVQLVRGPDLVPVDLFAGYWDSRNWSMAGAFPGSSSGSYVSLQFKVEAGYEFTPEGLSFYYEDGGDGNGPVRVEVRWSGDGFGSVLHSDVNALDGTVESVAGSAFGSTAASGTVEFRWYGYGAGSSNGVLGMTNHASLTADGNPVAVLLEGEVAVVPEPAAAAWLLALVALGWAFRRRGHGSG